MSRNRIKSIVLVFALVFIVNVIMPSLAFGLNIRYGYFPDVNDTHWAKQVITKMNLRGVVSGYEENGVFNYKPDRSVTQLEAVIMALRTMGLNDQEGNVDVGRYLSFTVPDWAKAVTLVGVDAGLIDSDDFVWNKEASRAWVAQLLVQMMEKEDEVATVSNETLPYYDSYSIPDEYLNYVKVANKYGLIKGNSDNTYKPNASVTRAQMVAFLSRAEKYLELKADNLIIGQVQEVNGENITVISDAGTEYTLVCTISTNMYKGGKEIWLGDLEEDDRVYVLVDSNIITYLELDPPVAAPKLSSLEGLVLQVFPEKNTLVVKTLEDELKTISLLDSTKMVDEANSSIDISSLAVDNEVKMSFNSKNEPVKLTLISGTSSTSGQGIIYHLDTKNRVITLEYNDGLSAYAYDSDVMVNIDNNRLATIDSLQIGDKVAVEATDSEIESITLIATEVDLNTSGVVIQISLENRIITYKTPEKEFKAQYLETDANIDFSGETGTISDIKVGDEIEVTIKNGNISNLLVNNRKIHEGLKGTVVSVDSTNRIITIKDRDSQLKAYEVDSDAEIVINDDEKAYLYEVKKDMAVEVEVDDEKIAYLLAKNTLTGKVVRANDNTNTLEIKFDTGETKLYSVDPAVDIDVEDDSSVDLDDLNEGDIVEIKIEDGEVTDIKVERIITYKVTDKYSSSSSRVYVTDKYDDEESLYIYSDVDLVIPGVRNPRVNDLQVNDIIKATYLGYSLQKVEAAPLVIGNVTSIDTNSQTIQVRGYDGIDYSYKFTTYNYVSKNGYSYNNLNLLATGDRVAVEENLDGGRVFNIMTKVTGKVGAMYKDKTKLYLQITQTNWKEYKMATSAYLHKGITMLTPADFKLNDQIDIYISGSKVYEVEKK